MAPPAPLTPEERAQVMAQWEAIEVASPRPMPADFAPLMEDQGDAVVCDMRLDLPDGRKFHLTLGYHKPEGDSANSIAMATFREAMWQASELARLGQVAELERMVK